MKTRTFFRPHFIVGVIFLVEFIIYGLYFVGIIPSYRITHKSTNTLGYIYLIIFYLLQILILYIGCHRRKKSRPPIQSIRCKNEKKVYRIVYAYMLISVFGMLRLLSTLRKSYGLIAILRMSLSNSQRDMLDRGSGNTILSVFCIVSLILLALMENRRSKKWIVTLIVNLVLLLLYSTVLSSRILLIQGVMFFVIIFFRKHWYRKVIRRKYIFIGIPLILVFLVITSGIRDYARAGKRYTNSTINWGVSRLADYAISSANYSLEANTLITSMTNSTFPNSTFEFAGSIIGKKEQGNNGIASYLKYGASEYTNAGAFYQVYSDFLWLFPILVVLLSLINLYAWKGFDRGSMLGLMTYPILFYSLVETWRLYFLGTTMGEMTLLLTVFTWRISKKYFIEQKIDLSQLLMEGARS